MSASKDNKYLHWLVVRYESYESCIISERPIPRNKSLTNPMTWLFGYLKFTHKVAYSCCWQVLSSIALT